MAEVKEAKVPDIGDYSAVPVIEILVKPGDTVSKDQGLITLESDKATMEVPSSIAGVVKEIKVKVGDEISEGTVVALIESADAAIVPSPVERGKVPQAEEGKAALAAETPPSAAAAAASPASAVSNSADAGKPSSPPIA
ncbi:MAG: biotin/lipoyl-containing protein, partial [Rudaea sp.]